MIPPWVELEPPHTPEQFEDSGIPGAGIEFAVVDRTGQRTTYLIGDFGAGDVESDEGCGCCAGPRFECGEEIVSYRDWRPLMEIES